MHRKVKLRKRKFARVLQNKNHEKIGSYIAGFKRIEGSYNQLFNWITLENVPV